MQRLLATHLDRLLAYHGWAYRRLQDSLRPLDEAQYRAPCGLFFGSLHGTLNHLAVADRIWLARLRRQPPPFARLDAEAVAERHALADYLQDGVQAWRQELGPYDDAALLQTLAYRTVRGEAQHKPIADLVLHLVNHGSHHRGQISAALTSLGHAAPVLDYLYFLAEAP